MNELRRFDLYPFQAEWGAGVDENDASDGDYCRADEALATIAERDAEIARQKATIAEQQDYHNLLRKGVRDACEVIDKLKATIAERDAQIAQLKKFMEFNSRSFSIMIAKHDAEVDRLNALVMAYHIREEKAASTAWQPFSGTSVPCENFDGCGVIQHNDYLVVWCGQEEAAMHLPDNVRLCKMVQP